MFEKHSEFNIERAAFSVELAADLGRITIHLDNASDGQAMNETKLKMTTDSLTAVQLVAREGSEVVGAATLTQLGGLMPNDKAWLEDFVVVPEVRGKGVADAIADEWEEWCQEREITTLMFTSGWNREAAHRFYLRRGSFILNNPTDKTAFFNYPIPAERSK